VRIDSGDASGTRAGLEALRAKPNWMRRRARLAWVPWVVATCALLASGACTSKPGSDAAVSLPDAAASANGGAGLSGGGGAAARPGPLPTSGGARTGASEAGVLDGAAKRPDTGTAMTKDSGPADAGSAPSDAGGSSDAGSNCEHLDMARPPQSLALTGNLGTHDPSMIEADGQYYEFQTGPGIPTKTSTDLLAWRAGPNVFNGNPAWIAQQVSGATDLWAPDISFFGGVYHLYYAASTFGSNHSCIGHATRATLSSGAWADQGSVICSNAPGKTDDWNAIDPNAVVDAAGTPWLAFGSFWSGLKLIKLDSSGKRADDQLHAIATRTTNGGAIEAPYIVHHCGHYYLFASFDTCCKGVDSTYNIRVGRADDIAGPYMDRAGTAMLQGGGTQVLQSGTRWKGPGHNAVLLTSHGAFNVYHSYDANNNGQSFLRIAELAWDDAGWPVSGGP
jgi:arabinan endo-1,5-alpha-L-arabinosidase